MPDDVYTEHFVPCDGMCLLTPVGSEPEVLAIPDYHLQNKEHIYNCTIKQVNPISYFFIQTMLKYVFKEIWRYAGI